jgi:hypothetical protein
MGCARQREPDGLRVLREIDFADCALYRDRAKKFGSRQQLTLGKKRQWARYASANFAGPLIGKGILLSLDGALLIKRKKPLWHFHPFQPGEPVHEPL